MDINDQLTLSRAMGKIEGLVSAMHQTVTDHVHRDDERFQLILDKLDNSEIARARDSKEVADKLAAADHQRHNETQVAVNQLALADRQRREEADKVAVHAAEMGTVNKHWKLTTIWQVAGPILSGSVVAGVVLLLKYFFGV